jgi:regulator of sigma D
MNSIRLESNELIENSSKKSLNYEAEINHLNIENKQKDSEILSLNEKLYRLEDQLSERYSLPDKIK